MASEPEAEWGQRSLLRGLRHHQQDGADRRPLRDVPLRLQGRGRGSPVQLNRYVSEPDILRRLLINQNWVLFSGEEVFDPMSWISHPSYNPNTVDYDFALVELDTIITWSKYVQPICLPEPDVPVRQGHFK